MKRYIAAGKFKAECLHLMEEVNQKHTEYIITKRRVPIAKLSPISRPDFSLFGCMKGTVHIKGDIISPIDEEWDANR